MVSRSFSHAKPVVVQSKQINGLLTIDQFLDWHQLGSFESCEEAYRHLEARWAFNGRCKEVKRNQFGFTVESNYGGIFEIRFFNWKTQKVLNPYEADDWRKALESKTESPWSIGISEAL